MHSLEIIVRRNAEAAGRELAHADRDMNQTMSEFNHQDSTSAEYEAFSRGYKRGEQEG
jgi:hypothetical protein